MSDPYEYLLLLLRRLKEAHIYHVVKHSHDDAISIDVNVPGERWEIDVFLNGDIYVEILRGDGQIYGVSKLDELFSKFSDP